MVVRIPTAFGFILDRVTDLFDELASHAPTSLWSGPVASSISRLLFEGPAPQSVGPLLKLIDGDAQLLGCALHRMERLRAWSWAQIGPRILAGLALLMTAVAVFVIGLGTLAEITGVEAIAAFMWDSFRDADGWWQVPWLLGGLAFTGATCVAAWKLMEWLGDR